VIQIERNFVLELDTESLVQGLTLVFNLVYESTRCSDEAEKSYSAFSPILPYPKIENDSFDFHFIIISSVSLYTVWSGLTRGHAITRVVNAALWLVSAQLIIFLILFDWRLVRGWTDSKYLFSNLVYNSTGNRTLLTSFIGACSLHCSTSLELLFCCNFLKRR